MFRVLAGHLGPKAREQPLHLDPLNCHRQLSHVSETTLVCAIKAVSRTQASRQDPPNHEVQPARLFISPGLSYSLGKEGAPGLVSSHQENYVCYTGFVQGKGIFLLTCV